MKASYDISRFSQPIQVICRAMKKHGLIVADNGSNWYICGAPDPRWNDDVLREIKTIPGSAFEAVLTVDSKGNPIRPTTALPQEKRRQSACARGIARMVSVTGGCLLRSSEGRNFDLRGKNIAYINEPR